MESRYFITGVQLGMLKAFIEQNDLHIKFELTRMLAEIEKNQYLGDAKYGKD